MKQVLTITLGQVDYLIDLNQGFDVSIPVSFAEQQLQAFAAPLATATPFSTDDFAASVAAGAGYNCPVFNFSAHLHGTHTECVGHISRQDHIVQDVAGYPGLMSALLITITPVSAIKCKESYTPEFNPADKVITQAALTDAFEQHPDPDPGLMSALVIRTLPNKKSKKTQNHDTVPPPFFSNEAMQTIAQKGFKHLLMDAPSVDRLKDQGKLSNHHIFWGVEQGSNDVPEASPKTITELIFVPDEIKDGVYMLNLNIGNIRSDATPSRPVLYTMTPV